jgi:hypothetical protein
MRLKGFVKRASVQAKYVDRDTTHVEFIFRLESGEKIQLTLGEHTFKEFVDKIRVTVDAITPVDPSAGQRYAQYLGMRND